MSEISQNLTFKAIQYWKAVQWWWRAVQFEYSKTLRDW